MIRLTPGIELDILVAKALGWRILVNQTTPPTIIGGLPPSHKETDCFVRIPAFSTSMAAAWALVTRKLLGFQLSQLPGDRWAAKCAGGDPVIGETGPHVICLAYLEFEGVSAA